ncbi:MAG: OmpA family protein [Prevotella sp.]|nr:OmpA family protein [Prevotella sp.]
MKRFKNILTAVALLMGVSTAVQAQGVEDSYPYNFISLQGGAQTTFTNKKFTDLITPQVALSVGRYFNSKVGARVHLQGWQIKSAITDTYKFNAITGDIDLLMNMSNIISPNRSCDKFDWVLLAGFGVNYGWDFDEFNTQNNALAINPNPYLCGTKHSSYNTRLGMQFNYNLSDKLALGLEVDGNMKNDEFNLKRNYDPDFQVQALIGLTYKFGQPAKKRVREVVETYYVDEPYTEMVKKQRPIETVEVSKMEKVVYYMINVTDVEQGQGVDVAIKEAADLIKTDPNAKIFVTGYADVQTGNAEINERLSKERAEGVANKLVNEHGINAANITIDWKGDTVQPFAENDKNRCVIIKGEGNFKVTKYETYEEPVEKTRRVEKTRTITVE